MAIPSFLKSKTKNRFLVGIVLDAILILIIWNFVVLPHSAPISSNQQIRFTSSIGGKKIFDSVVTPLTPVVCVAYYTNMSGIYQSNYLTNFREIMRGFTKGGFINNY